MLSWIWGKIVSFAKFYFRDHLRYMLRHWLPLVLIAVVWAFIYGKIGQGFGVPLLFRDDPAYGYAFDGGSLNPLWWLNRPSIAGYTAATVLLAAFLAVAFIFDVVGKKRRERFETAVTGGPVVGVQPPSRTRQAISFFTVAGALPILLLLWGAANPGFELAEGAPICAENNTYCAATADQDGAAVADGTGGGFHGYEALKAVAGILLGGAIAFLCGLMVFVIGSAAYGIGMWLRQNLPAQVDRLDYWLGWLRYAVSETARRETPLVIGTIATVTILGVGFYALASMGYSLAALTRPGAAICIFAGVLIVFYFLLLVMAPSLRFIGVIGFLAIHAFIGDDIYINELPGFMTREVAEREGEQVLARGNYYRCLLPLDEDGQPVDPGKRAACGDEAVEQTAFNSKTPVDAPPLLKAEDWAAQWVDAKPGADPKKLVVIATQGGAYRASFWTSMILDELSKKDSDGDMPGLVDHIGLMTGASGGMVASAYFTVMASKGEGWQDRVQAQDCGMNAKDDTTWLFGPVTSQLCRDVHEAVKPDNAHSKFTSPRPIARDSLTPVAAQTILYDMSRVLQWPLTTLLGHDGLHWNSQTHHDRGLILERQWGTLHKSYGELARLQQAQREAGRRHPSMIISPMIADTGQPILISNLDLHGLTHDGLGEAVSMFDWFPDIREDFRVQTAVRMNASFPYISPAVSLPTTARRRVVDAGYYDNYGVNTAVSWLFQDEVIERLVEEEAGIDGLIFIQIRAFPGRDQGRQEPPAVDGEKSVEEAIARMKQPHKPDIPLIPEWLTSPLAGVLAARSGSMAYRNDAQIERLKKVLMAKGKSEDFVQSIVFENRIETDQAGVSWHITPNELAKLETELQSPRNRCEFERLAAFWNSAPPPAADQGELIAESENFERIEPAADNPTPSCTETRAPAHSVAVR